MKKIAINKELAEICEYSYRKGFNDACKLANADYDCFEEVLKKGIKNTRKHFKIK